MVEHLALKEVAQEPSLIGCISNDSASRTPQPRPPHPPGVVKGNKAVPTNPLGLALRNRRAGDHTLVWARPDLQAPESFSLTSPAFDHGKPIPERYRGRLFGANISPALAWTTPPTETAELVLIVQDPDVPFGKPPPMPSRSASTRR